MPKFVYVCAVKYESDEILARVEAAAGTRGTPPKKRKEVGDQRSMSTRAAPIAATKYDHRPEQPRILFFTSRVYTADQAGEIEIDPADANVRDAAEDWALVQV